MSGRGMKLLVRVHVKSVLCSFLSEVGYKLSTKLSSSQAEGNMITYRIHRVYKMKINHVALEKCDCS